MKYCLRLAIAACAFALAPSPASAQPAAPVAPPPAAAAPAATPAPLPDANPALWVVRDADTTIYLFGTFHLLDGRRDWFNDEVRTAFDSAQQLVLEAIIPEDPGAVQAMVLRYAIDPNGRTLSSHLTPAQQAALAAALQPAGLPPTAFDRLEPWFAAMTLTTVNAQRLGIQPQFGAETVLSAAARERHIPIGELESMEGQLRMLDALPEAVQVRMLTETVGESSRLPQTLGAMLAAWSDGETDRLASLLNEGLGGDPELYRLLLTERNRHWADWIQQRLAQPGTVFIAVGAGHLGGHDSVREILAARGITATRVPHTAH